MPIDSTVVNGQFVFNDRISDAVLAIDNGIFISGIPDAEDGAWRTVNASGYFVMPGLVQAVSARDLDELNLALQGVTTVIPEFSAASAEELFSEVSDFERSARINFLPCWDIPASSNVEQLSEVTERGIRIFTVHDLATGFSVLQHCHLATIRVPGSSPFLRALVANQGNSRIVILIQSADQLEQIADLLENDMIYAEAPLDLLLENYSGGSPTTVFDQIDIVTVARDAASHPLLPVLFHSFFGNCNDSMRKISELASRAPAIAHGLEDRKSRLETGADADFFVLDPDNADNWNRSSFPGRVIFSQARGQILLYNEAVDILPGQAKMER